MKQFIKKLFSDSSLSFILFCVCFALAFYIQSMQSLACLIFSGIVWIVAEIEVLEVNKNITINTEKTQVNISGDELGVKRIKNETKRL